ncbi:MAG: hypothetical protein JWO46_2119 [Nocardioidaceae bacterium]|nr:hypothetical protein [Nocardioidaceae bacterium]
MNDSDGPSGDPTSIVHDNALTLDLTRRPTRESFGIPDGKNDRAYQRKGDMLKATVKLPGGSFETPAFLVQGSSNIAGGANDTVTTHEPKSFDVFAVYENGEEALAAVRERATVLGIDPASLDQLSGDLGTDATVTQSRVLQGLVHDWLSTEVVLTDQDAGKVQVQYEFDVDVYHNAAADKVLRDGVMALDLTHAPTREDLGFLPTYRTADVNAEPGTTLTARVTTPGGSFDVVSDQVSSSSSDPTKAGGDPGGTGRPRSTVITRTGSVADLHASLLAQADVLGLDKTEVDAAFTGAGRQQKTFTPPATDVYTLTVTTDVQPDRGDAFAGSVKYSLVYP